MTLREAADLDLGQAGGGRRRPRPAKRVRRWRRRTIQAWTIALGVALAAGGSIQLAQRAGGDGGTNPADPTATATPGLWATPADVLALPTTGPAWDALVKTATAPWPPGDLKDQDSTADTSVFAGALYAVRLGDEPTKERVEAALRSLPGTEDGARVLAVARNLPGYLIAADLIGYHDPAFEAWIDTMRFKLLDGKSIISTHEERPNNWGTHAGAARIAIDRYLGDTKDLGRAATVFKGYLGDRNAYAGFIFGIDLSWQADPTLPVAVNPVGAVLDGKNVDGVLPEEARRVGPFQWPFPTEAKGSNYLWEALQGVVVQAEMLSRAGYATWEWQDRAVLRAYRWLYDTAGFPAEGDDTWQVWIVNRAYDAKLPTTSPTRAGKNMGFTDWTHQPAPVPPTASVPPTEPVPPTASVPPPTPLPPPAPPTTGGDA